MYKQVIVMRKDLKMGKGKMIAQAAHASIGSAYQSDDGLVEKWMEEGSKKIVLKVEGERELKVLAGDVKRLKIPCFLVKDAGLTQLKSGTVTALGIGPAKEKEIDKATGKLKLL